MFDDDGRVDMTGGKITLYIATSVDGFVATDDGGVAWLDGFEDGAKETDDKGEDGDEGEGYAEFFAGVGCLVMGARTYEQVLTFGEWPYEERPTYVLTHGDLPRATDRVEFLAGEVENLAADLGERYEHVWLVGGAAVAQEFFRANEVDELWLSVIPRLLGSGISLFGDSETGHELNLTESTSHANGIVELRYDVH